MQRSHNPQIMNRLSAHHSDKVRLSRSGTVFDHIKCISLRCLVGVLFGPRREKTCLQGVGNNKGTAHACSLISAFVFRLLESIISTLATSQISIF